jgi:hypothetical protein
MSTPTPTAPSSPRRPGRPKRPEDPKLAVAVAAAREALGKKRPPGSRDVTAGDVEFAAMALVQAGAQPHPRLIVRITGGSLSTVSRHFQEWFAAFAQRSLDPADPRLDLPTKVTLRLQLLVANLVAAAREQLLGVKKPEEVFQAAAELGERQALKAQLDSLVGQRTQLTQALEAATYRIAKLEAQAAEKAVAAKALAAAVQHLTETLAGRPARALTVDTTLKRVLAQVNSLHNVLLPAIRVRAPRGRNPQPTKQTARSRRRNVRPAQPRRKKTPRRRGLDKLRRGRVP